MYLCIIFVLIYVHQYQGYRICKVGSTISCKSTVSGMTIERCISPEYICDGYNDCLNGNNNLSDEYGCTYSEDDKDEKQFVICGGLDRRKLPEPYICNFQVDCLNGEDELDCREFSHLTCSSISGVLLIRTSALSAWKNCSENEFQCDDGFCIPLADRCNARVDCNDKSDETNCTGFKCTGLR